MNNAFDVYAEYYDLFYQEKDYAVEVNYIRRLLVKHGVVAQALFVRVGLPQMVRLKWLKEYSTGFDAWFVSFLAVKGT